LLQPATLPVRLRFVLSVYAFEFKRHRTQPVDAAGYDGVATVYPAVVGIEKHGDDVAVQIRPWAYI